MREVSENKREKLVKRRDKSQRKTKGEGKSERLEKLMQTEIHERSE